MKRKTLLLFILSGFLFNGCTKECKPQIVVKTKYIKTKEKEAVNLDVIKDCDMDKGVHFDDLNDTHFWVGKNKLVECSNTAMERKDKNIIYERQNKDFK